jgi:hypothetical protein
MWAAFTSILVSYHVFLAWLIVMDDEKKSLSLSIPGTIATHAACLVVVVGLALGRHVIPLLGLVRYAIPALAPFERNWLFSGKEGEHKPSAEVAAPVTAVPVGTAEDYQEWLNYLAQQKPGSRKPGTSLKTEYERWLLARVQARSTQSANDVNLSAM